MLDTVKRYLRLCWFDTNPLDFVESKDFLKRFTEYKNNKNMLYLMNNYDIHDACKNIFHLDYNT